MKFDDLASSFEPAPEGLATGILTAFIDRGEQAGKFGPRRQVVLHWLLPDVETESGTPAVVYQTVWNLSMKSKVFRETVAGLMGSEDLHGRSLAELVGRSARLSITHNEHDGQVFANIASVKPLPKGAQRRPPADQVLTYFSLDADEYDETVLNTLPEREQERIRNSPTYAQTRAVLAARAKPTAELINDGLPDFAGGTATAKPRRKQTKKAAAQQREAPDSDGFTFDAA
jgi:hypothetical protein